MSTPVFLQATSQPKTTVDLRGVIAALAAVIIVVSLLAIFAWNAEHEAVQAKNMANVRLASLLSSEAEQAVKSKPQLGLLLAVEGVSLLPEIDNNAPVTCTLHALQQALSTTTSNPLRGSDMHVITDVVRIAVSPIGQWLAAGSQSGMLHLWNLTTGDPDAAQVSLPLHNNEVTALAFSPDGHWLSTGCEDAVVNLFDLTLAKVVPSKLPIFQTRRVARNGAGFLYNH